MRKLSLFRVGLFLNLALVFLCSSPVKSELAFPSERTWIFMAGLLEWEDAETFESFPQENRQDKQLIAFFQKAGVPSSQIRQYHDNEATLAKVRRGLAEFVKGIPKTVASTHNSPWRN